jgi:predicted CoA-substrate-specific enzyme activase
MKQKSLILGIDIGSTTAKVVLTDNNGIIIHSDYIRHNTKIQETLVSLLHNISKELGDIHVAPVFTGSAGMGIAEEVHFPFVQEVIAASAATSALYQGTKSLIDIGGEDAKLVLFNDLRKPDIRMNGNCAGGTGAYIDQMASLLNVSVSELNEMAWKSTQIYPIASRCGVFAKTDVQNLISRKINIHDIAASIFDAVASQVLNSLARGCTVEPKLLFCGGPLTYISYLRKSFANLLKINESNIIVPERAELFTALGTALSVPASHKVLLVSELQQKLNSRKISSTESNTLKTLFSDKEEFLQWDINRNIIPVPVKQFENNENCFLGIDSGSTTTKITLINREGKLLYHFYRNNSGKPLETVVDGLKEFALQLEQQHKTINICKAAVTGYGEELIKSALGIDYGIVETVAHFVAAKKIEPEVSFILDIGGQDIKAIYVQNNTITNIEINEACSSGCGSFIEGFAHTLGYTPADFSTIATQSHAPYDLGSRCTVFMNSKVKQALRDGATIPDLSAGLAYSVIKNCLNKVLKIKSYSDIGENIVVQGGTFRNKAVFRSLELLSGKKIFVSDKPELMGAYGAALYALNKSHLETQPVSGFVGLEQLESIKEYSTKLSSCKGCTNNCQITVYKFSNGRTCYSGNKCEKTFSNNPTALAKGENVFEYKKQLLFSKTTGSSAVKDKIRIGIPRILNMYENYPFWNTLLTNCGFEVVLSDESSHALYKKGHGAIMSDNICFPAKLAHGHIVNLVEKQVNRIFLPFVVFEKKEFDKSSNSFNCPIVTGYSEVLKSTSVLLETMNIPFDCPGINFNNEKLLRQACNVYLKSIGVKLGDINKAFKAAISAQEEFKVLIKVKNQEILANAITHNKPVVLVASHPYHIDQLVHQQVSQILSDLGVNVINEEIAANKEDEGFDRYFSVSQWEYPNRILQAAWWVARHQYDVGLIQLNSFGCGPDSFITDEINELTKRNGVSYALIRIDEISSPGSTKLRLRSMVESLKLKSIKKTTAQNIELASSKLPIYGKSDINKVILVPWFSDFYSPFVPILGKQAGYKVVNLPPSNQESINLGLDYANNEVCYPATLVVGDVIKALKSGQYNLDEIAIGMTQTGGQCRATNYIALIKRALVSAGYKQIPVIAIASAEGLNNQQPGFDPQWGKIIKPTFITLLFADGLSRMYYATICREKHAGSTLKLRNEYIAKALCLAESKAYNKIFALFNEAVRDFNTIEVHNNEVESVGIVGEIYIKYNSFGQFKVIDWLIENRIEVVIPPLVQFFMQAFVNTRAWDKDNITQPKTFSFIQQFLEWRAVQYINKFEKVLKTFKNYRPVYDINHEAKLASDILSLSNQYGEGWLIPAEIASFSKLGIHNVICLQPFGCIANHVIGKGMEKKVKQLYPEVNLLYLDFDYGTSEVNVLNRLHFLIQNKAQTLDELDNTEITSNIAVEA